MLDQGFSTGNFQSGSSTTYYPKSGLTDMPSFNSASPSPIAAPSVNYNTFGNMDMNERLRASSASKPAGGGVYNYDPNNKANPYSTKPAGSMQNDQSLTNNYLSALNTYGDMRKIQGEMDGVQRPQQSVLPNFNADQDKAFFSALGGMFGGTGQHPGQTGLNQLFGGMSQQPQAPQMKPGDNSRFADDPFKVNANALR